MKEKDLLIDKKNLIEEYNRNHLYNVEYFYDLFSANINLNNVEIIQGPDVYVGKDQVIDIVKRFFNSISEDYELEFEKYLSNEKINFNSKESACWGNVFKDKFLNIGLKSRNNLEDVFSLTHEFFHVLSSKKCNKKYTQTKELFSELPPILAELFLIDFFKENGFDSSKYKETRIRYVINNVAILTDFTKLYYLANANSFTIEKISELFNDRGDKYINSLLKSILQNKIDLDDCIKHTFPLLIALKLKEKNIPKEKLIELTNNLWTKDVHEYEKIIGIDFDSINPKDSSFFKESVDGFLSVKRHK